MKNVAAATAAPTISDSKPLAHHYLYEKKDFATPIANISDPAKTVDAAISP